MSQKILYLSTSYVPFRRADSVHVMKMCQALSTIGYDVTLTTKRSKRYKEFTNKSDYEFYGVKQSFKIKKLWRPLFKGGDLIFSLLTLFYVITKCRSTDIIFSRSNLLALLTGFLGIPLIYEMHGMPHDKKTEQIHQKIVKLKNLKTVVVISKALKNDLLEFSSEIANRIIVAHDGADYNAVNAEPIVSERLNIGYVGHLYAGRGIELILDCAQHLPEYDFNIIGGEEKDISYFKALKNLDNVIFHGFVSPGELSRIYAKQDILLMPYQNKVGIASGTLDTSKWMSPMKMFEYMSTGKAIISSDIPVLKEVLTDKHNAILLPPERTDLWIAQLKSLATDEQLRITLGRNAQSDLKRNFTWKARAENVMLFFKDSL
uniref:glycosyltransferase family 4 protein n=4 Tax=Roseivirga sp. TaxID=1964215 RepID=UPI00404780D8